SRILDRQNGGKAGVDRQDQRKGAPRYATQARGNVQAPSRILGGRHGADCTASHPRPESTRLSAAGADETRPAGAGRTATGWLERPQLARRAKRTRRSTGL